MLETDEVIERVNAREAAYVESASRSERKSRASVTLHEDVSGEHEEDVDGKMAAGNGCFQ